MVKIDTDAFPTSSSESMSAEPLIRELFRSLETTIHERLSLIEQVLHTVEKPKVPLFDTQFISRIERLERLVSAQPSQNVMENSLLEERITALEENLASAFADIERIKETYFKPISAIHTQGVESVPMPSPILPLVTHTVDMLLTGDEKVVDEEPVVEVVEDEQEQEEEEEQEEVIEEEEQQEEEEEEELSLEEFEYKGKTYYKDAENQVYQMDEEGDISDPIGVWNQTKNRIIPFSH
jgi:hypothetical protein